MKFVKMAVVALVLLTSATVGQTVKMPEQIVLDPSVGLPMSVQIEWDGDDVSWTTKLGDDIVVFREHSSDPKSVRLMLFISRGAKEGTYYLQAASCKDKKMSPFASTKIVVRSGTPVPPGPTPPPPGPNPPGPTPDPGPVKVGKVYAVCLMDDTRTQAQSKVVGDAAMWARLEEAGNRYRVYEKTRDAGLISEKKLAKYPPLAGGYPCIVLMDATGGVLKYQSLPKTSEELENIVRNYNK